MLRLPFDHEFSGSDEHHGRARFEAVLVSRSAGARSLWSSSPWDARQWMDQGRRARHLSSPGVGSGRIQPLSRPASRARASIASMKVDAASVRSRWGMYSMYIRVPKMLICHSDSETTM